MKVYFCKRKIFETSIVMKKTTDEHFQHSAHFSTYFREMKLFSTQNASFFSKSWSCGLQTLSNHTCSERFFVPKQNPPKSRRNARIPLFTENKGKCSIFCFSATKMRRKKWRFPQSKSNIYLGRGFSWKNSSQRVSLMDLFHKNIKITTIWQKLAEKMLP